MAHHKRRRPPSARAGCRYKPWTHPAVRRASSERLPPEVRADERMKRQQLELASPLDLAWRLIPAPLGDRLLEHYETRRRALEEVDPAAFPPFESILRRAVRVAFQ